MRGKIGYTAENLEAAFENEIKANVEEYPRLIREASEEGMESVEKVFLLSQKVESRHAELYKRAMKNLLENEDTEYFVCQICGYVAEDEQPENCPMCGAVRKKFKAIE
jgi:rubrerythrin